MPRPGATRDRDLFRGCPSRSGKPRAHLLGEGGHLLHELVAIGGEEFENQVSNAAVRQLDELIDQVSSLAGEHPSTVGRSRHALARPKDARVITKRDGRGLGAAADLGEACQLRSARPQLLWRAIDRVPGDPELDGAAERGPAVPPDPDRWVWLLERLLLADESAELGVIIRIRGRPTGPKLTQRLQIFIGHGAALRQRHALPD